MNVALSWATSKEGTIVSEFLKLVRKPNGEVEYKKRVPLADLMSRLDLGFRTGALTEQPSREEVIRVLDGLHFTRTWAASRPGYVGGEELRRLAQAHGLA